MSDEDWRPQDLMIHFFAEDGSVEHAKEILAEATGAHDFKVAKWHNTESIRFSLADTPYATFDRISPELRGDSDDEGLSISDGRLDSSHYNMHLVFPFDPTFEDEFSAIVTFARAIGSRSPTLLLDGDERVIYSSLPVGGDHIDPAAIPA